MPSDGHRLSECVRLYEETNDLARCLEIYPEFRDELEALEQARTHLNVIQAPVQTPLSRAVSRRELLSALAHGKSAGAGRPRWFGRPALAGLVLAAVLGMSAAGATAAGNNPVSEVVTRGGSGVSQVLQVVGLAEGDHGRAVSQAVHEAIANTPPGTERGAAVSRAACEAARDRSTLPQGAQEAPGFDASEQEPCTEDDGEGSLSEIQQEGDGGEHGAAVREAVQDALANTPPGPERGAAVSRAACEAARDRSTLPQGAQDAQGFDASQQEPCGDDGGESAEIEIEQESDGGEHGAAVSEAVQQALANTPPGPERGAAVAQAACEAAKDRSTLPPEAQDPPGIDPEEQDACDDIGGEAEPEGDEGTPSQIPPEGAGPPEGIGPPGGIGPQGLDGDDDEDDDEEGGPPPGVGPPSSPGPPFGR